AGASRELAQIIVNDESCTGVGTRRPESIMVQPLSDQASVLGKKALLVDDVFGSEHTLAWPMTV
ncbi:MAG: hypothetical protein LH471_04850, partial [Salinibacterium sp.]|nr:hypothetical protein [Salinibacterium sp.]